MEPMDEDDLASPVSPMDVDLQADHPLTSNGEPSDMVCDTTTLLDPSDDRNHELTVPSRCDRPFQEANHGKESGFTASTQHSHQPVASTLSYADSTTTLWGSQETAWEPDPSNPAPASKANVSKRKGTSLYRPWKKTKTKPDAETNQPADLPKLTVPGPNDQLASSIQRLNLPLMPLVSVTTGLEHPWFPKSIMQYLLLTHDQIDSLATWYHQTNDAGIERWMYPKPIEKPWLFNNTDILGLDLYTKRRRFGKFIGLQGCQSPVVEYRPEPGPSTSRDEDEFDVTEYMARRWRDAMRRAEEEKERQEKFWRGYQ